MKKSTKNKLEKLKENLLILNIDRDVTFIKYGPQQASWTINNIIKEIKNDIGLDIFNEESLIFYNTVYREYRTRWWKKL